MSKPLRQAAGTRLPLDEARDRLLIQVAKMYFLLDRTQSDIAKDLGLTRWQVGRLLHEAREAGVVRIEICSRSRRLAALEAELQARWGLQDAVVVPSDGDEGSDAASVAQAAADWLSGLADKPRVIGVSWGRTMAAVARALPQGWNPEAQIVLVNGATALKVTAAGIGSVAEVFAQTAGGEAVLLPAPAILGRAETRAALESDPVIAAALDLAARARMVVFGMGGMADSVLQSSGYLDAAEMARLRQLGAVGDLLGRFVDAEGAVVDAALDARSLGLRLEALQRMPVTVGVVSGAAKAAVALSALRAGLATVLITDETIARHILATFPSDPRG